MTPQPAFSTRRNFLRGTGVTLSLPWLESLCGIAHAAEAGKEPRRLLLIWSKPSSAQPHTRTIRHKRYIQALLNSWMKTRKPLLRC